MGTKFFFKSFSIDNFRVFRKIDFKRIKRLNVISGINGSGKSALIETMFLSMDMANPASLLRPFLFRQIPLGGDDLRILFPSTETPSQISAKTSQGQINIKLDFGFSKDDGILSSSNNFMPNRPLPLSQLSSSKVEGVNFESSENGNLTRKLFIFQANGALNTSGHWTSDSITPIGIFLSHSTPTPPQESADRVSQLIKKGKKQNVIKYLAMLEPSIEDVVVFQDGQVAQVYVERKNELLTPLALMGGGFRAFFEIVTSAMASNGGVIFIDEVDSALHFSIVPKLWELLATIADIENVQVFAITHSRETISSAAQGVRDAGRSSDFQYVRIDTLSEYHRCTQYDMEELQDAIELRVEVR
jgi:hypothetical protein